MNEQLSRILGDQVDSFVYDGKPSTELLPGWESSLSVDEDTSTLVRTDPVSGLRVTRILTVLPCRDAAEWSIAFTNTSDRATPLIEQIRTLDLRVPLDRDVRPVLHALHGSTCALDDFEPIEHELSCGDRVVMAPQGGRSSDGAMPFFAVRAGVLQLGVALGWSGQWTAELRTAATELQVRSGLHDARLSLLPGESITTGSVLVVVPNGPERDVINRLRSVLRRDYLPKTADGRPVTPIAHMTMAAFHRTGQASEENELANIAKAAELGLEAYWVDACWYGNTSNWYEEVGNWFVRRTAFPHGLRPLSDAAHGAGMKFVCWLEPERARRGSALAREHPEFFLHVSDEPENFLLDLGRDDARSYVIELISGLIRDFGVDIYRQDFNIAPLAAWREADEPGRRGMTEIRYVEGLYAVWDELLRRHPGLVIDNCASGGRRIDLETMRRSVPLWRSDFADVGGGAASVGISIANQIQTAGLSSWIAQHTGPIWSFDAYSTRSALSTGMVIYRELPTSEAEHAEAVAAVTELKRLRPRMDGEFHLLTPITAGPDQWLAYQFHDPSTDAGFAVFLRRSDTAAESRTFALQGMTRSHYRVSQSDSYLLAEPIVMSGAALKETVISMATAPSSLLLEYSTVDLIDPGVTNAIHPSIQPTPDRLTRPISR